MTPIKVDGCTRRLERPHGMPEEDCGALEIVDLKCPIWGNTMRSAWLPTDEEREAIASGAPVVLEVVGKSHPVVALMVGTFQKPEV